MSTELYGIDARLVQSKGTTPVSTQTEIVFLGAAPNLEDDSAPVNEPVLINSISDYTIKLGGVVGDGWSLSEAAECAFSLLNIDHVWMINVNGDSSTSMASITDAMLIGDASLLTGAYAVLKLYPEHGKICNVLCSPNASKAVNAVLASVVKKMNGHFDGIICYDLKQTSSQINASKVALPNVISADKVTDGVIDERALCCWPSIKTVNNNVVSSAAYIACMYAKIDADYNSIPMRSIGNNSADNVSYLTLKSNDSKIILSDSDATSLSADGIISFINLGAGRYATWGDHTSAFINDSITDERGRFDSNIRMLLKLTNDFQLKWGNVIDRPMTLGLRNDIINYEQSKLNYYVSIGALIGNPKFLFSPTSNTGDSLAQGQFYFDSLATITPPSKYIKLNLAFTSEGYTVYLEQ